MKFLIASVAVISGIVFFFGDLSTVTHIEEVTVIKEAGVTHGRTISPGQLKLLEDERNLDTVISRIYFMAGNIPVVVLLASMITLETHSLKYSQQHPLKSIIGKGIVALTRVINLIFPFKETKVFVVDPHAGGSASDKHALLHLSPYGIRDLADSSLPQSGTPIKEKLIKVTTQNPTKMFHPINGIFGVGSLIFADSILSVPGSDQNMYNYGLALFPIVVWSTIDLQGLLLNGSKNFYPTKSALLKDKYKR